LNIPPLEIFASQSRGASRKQPRQGEHDLVGGDSFDGIKGRFGPSVQCQKGPQPVGVFSCAANLYRFKIST